MKMFSPFNKFLSVHSRLALSTVHLLSRDKTVDSWTARTKCAKVYFCACFSFVNRMQPVMPIYSRVMRRLDLLKSWIKASRVQTPKVTGHIFLLFFFHVKIIFVYGIRYSSLLMQPDACLLCALGCDVWYVWSTGANMADRCKRRSRRPPSALPLSLKFR